MYRKLRVFRRVRLSLLVELRSRSDYHGCDVNVNRSVGGLHGTRILSLSIDGSSQSASWWEYRRAADRWKTGIVITATFDINCWEFKNTHADEKCVGKMSQLIGSSPTYVVTCLIAVHQGSIHHPLSQLVNAYQCVTVLLRRNFHCQFSKWKWYNWCSISL